MRGQKYREIIHLQLFLRKQKLINMASFVLTVVNYPFSLIPVYTQTLREKDGKGRGGKKEKTGRERKSTETNTSKNMREGEEKRSKQKNKRDTQQRQ